MSDQTQISWVEIFGRLGLISTVLRLPDLTVIRFIEPRDIKRRRLQLERQSELGEPGPLDE